MPVSLREFYLGSVKVVVYQRQVLALDGHTLKEEGESCVKTLVIKQGWTLGQKLKFKGEGNQQYKRDPTDLIITLVAAPEPTFYENDSERCTKRLGQSDLIYTADITLQQALIAEPVTIQSLDCRFLKVAVDGIITPRTVIKIPSEGMPIPYVRGEDSSVDPLDAPRKGDLYVKFNIKFPKKLSDSQRQRIEAVLLRGQ